MTENKNKEKIKKEIEDLRKEINKHNRLYYIENNPQISDFEYDLLMNRLIELEKNNPEFISPDSPTQKVGGEALSEFKTVEHKIPMKSLGNTYNEDDLKDFDQRVRKEVGDNIQYCAEPKIDGVSISIKYENGNYRQAITRGDGTKGDDVSINIKTIKELPLTLKEKVTIELRGEIYITASDFNQLNKQREKEGKNSFANPRNFTAGTLKTLDPKEVAKRPLRIFLYNIADIEEDDLNKELDTHYKRIEYVKKLGLPTIEYYKLCKDINETIEHINNFYEIKKTLDYETDGMVIKVNSITLQEELGYTSKEPRWAIAYKYPTQRMTTTINNIVYQVGRLGSITPVAKVNPVFLSGTTVTSATLHNFDEVARKDIRIGDKVLIEKAGEIIPQVVQVIKEERPEDAEKVEAPANCPVCKTELVKDEGEVALRCPNYDCPEQKVLRIAHFTSKYGMDIEGMGEKYVRKFMEKGLLNNISDIYYLNEKREEIESLEGFGKKSVENLLNAIEKSKNNPLFMLIKALGIRYVGGKAARILAQRFHSLDNLMNASYEDLESIYEIGSITAKSVYEYFRDERHKKQIDRLKKEELNMKSEKEEPKKTNTKIAGKKFVITGTLPTLKRDEAKKLIEKYGGNITSTVSKKTDYLVIGDKPGSKYDKAKKLGITTINEEELISLTEEK